MEWHGHGDRHVDANHSNLDPMRKLAGGISVAGKDRRAVAELVLIHEVCGLAIILRTHNAKYGTKNLLLVDLHVGSDTVKERASDEIAVLEALHLEAATVDKQVRTLPDAGVDVFRDLLKVLLGYQRAHFRFRIRTRPD